jgi:uncharacterized protein
MSSPVRQDERQGVLDMLRGWALLGVVIVNYTAFVGSAKGSFMVLDIISDTIKTVLFLTKSWMLLSFLFGYGFGFLMGKFGVGPGGDRFFLRRMFLLLLLSFLNILIFPGDILHDYALIGILLLPLNRLGARPLFVLGILFLSALIGLTVWLDLAHRSIGVIAHDGYWKEYLSRDLGRFFRGNLEFFHTMNLSFHYGVVTHLVMLAMMTFGLSAMKSGFLPRLLAEKKLRKRCFWISVLLVVLVIGLMAFGAMNFPKSNFGVTSNYFFSGAVGSVFFMVWIMVYANRKMSGFFGALETVGRMTLTNYLVQNLLSVVFFSGMGFGWAQRPDDWAYLALALSVFMAQVMFSRWWLTRYEYGPVEWLWRCLSYGKWFPLHRSDPQKS